MLSPVLARTTESSRPIRHSAQKQRPRARIAESTPATSRDQSAAHRLSNLKHVLQQPTSEPSPNEPAYPESIERDRFDFLAKRSEQKLQLNRVGRDEVVAQALEIIWGHCDGTPLNVNDVARQLPVTRRTLDRRFADHLGHSVLEEINACRLTRARRLLAETDLLIKTVSYLAGFPSRERMRLLFLSETGMSPSEYRESVQSEVVAQKVRVEQSGANASGVRQGRTLKQVS